ncbi:MAG: cardiolipin synthase [Eubacterium sp.]|nr:cardiolipin synthase [Eubacterium sp.]
MLTFLPPDHPLSIFTFIVNILLSSAIIFLERKTPQSTYAWLLFLWIIPILGFIFYLFFSQNLTKRKIYRYNTPEAKQYKQLLSLQKNALVTHQYFARNNDLLEKYHYTIEYHFNVSHSLYSENNHVAIYTDGHAKFDALFAAIEAAKTSIHLEYYIIKYDALGKRFMELLIKKARQGVEVRLLFDEMGGRYLPRSILKEFKQAGGAYGIFFPSKLRYINLRVNYRDHRKIAIIDGTTAFIGGYNIGDEYLGLKKKMGYWRDTHLKITGYAAYELQMRFFLDWRTSGNPSPLEDSHKDISRYYPPMENNGGAGIQIVSSGPDDPNQGIKQGFIRIITNARRYIFIQSPYFVTDESIMEALKIALLSGIEVRIMIPNKPDHVFIYWATLSYVGELIEYGAQVYIYDNGFLHAKVVVADDEIAAVGSCNFDIRSFRLNFETNAFLYDRAIATELRDIFLADIDQCLYYDKISYMKRPRRVKIKESISRLFAPLL